MTAISIYFIVGYYKKYLTDLTSNKSFNCKMLIGSLVLLVLLHLSLDFMGLHVNALADKLIYFAVTSNPLVIAIGLYSFFIFKEHTFYSKSINYISGLSLIVYLIHENILARYYMRIDYWNWINSYFDFSLFSTVSLFILSIIVFAFLIAAFYSSTFKMIKESLISKAFRNIIRNPYGF